MRKYIGFAILFSLSVCFVPLSTKASEIKGTWIPQDEDRVAINEELTFTDTLFYWKSGIFPSTSVWTYDYSNKQLIIYNGKQRMVFKAYVKNNILYWNDRTYRIKK